MKIKNGVSLVGLQLPMRNVLIQAADIWDGYNQELVITAGTDGTHSPGSLHPFGYALDLRTRYFSESIKKEVAIELKQRLGVDYDVIVHKTHIHVEYQQILEME